MIGRIDIRANAAHPNFPIPPVYMFAGAPSSPRVFGVPCRVGSWAITAVSVAVAYPDNSTRTVSLTQVDGTWIGIIPACATTGAVQNGVQIVADGTDENGDAVTGYCLGVGDLFVMERDFTATADGTRYYFHYCEEVPTAPQVGDTAYTGGVLKWFDGTAWRDFGGGHDAAKLDGAAAYPAWDATQAYHEEIVSYGGRLWYANGTAGISIEPPEYPWVEKTVSELLGAKQDALSSAQIGYINDVPNKADKTVPSATGNLAALNAQGNLADSGVKPSDFAFASDLPYRLVEPGKWEFSDGLNRQLTGPVFDGELLWYYYIDDSIVSQYFNTEAEASAALSLSFGDSLTATRASLPGHLLDRANNLIDAQTGNVTLTLPPFEAGKVRDLLVACTIGVDGNDEPWSVIFQGQGSEAPSGADEISFKAEGDDAASATFPVPDAAGDWWYSLTERAPHVFAVSLKQLQSVSQPTQTQGGV